MADPQADEIEALVAQASEETSDEDEATPAKPPRRRSRAKAKPATTMEELDAADVLPSQLPEPEENVKTLSDLYVKYDVGQNPEFKVQIYRSWPKVHNGQQIDGMIDTWTDPMLEEQIHAEYGGGQYRIVVVGPNPKSPNLLRHYASHKIKLSGPPNLERLPRAIQGTVPDNKNTGAQNANPPPLMMQENPKLAEAALKMMNVTATAEREERRRLEDKYERERELERERKGSVDPTEAYRPIIEAERRRSDDVIAAQQQRLESERLHYEQRAAEARQQAEETRRRVEQMEANRPSIGRELRELAQAGLFNRNDDGTKVLLEQVLQKHRDEMASMQKQHTDFIRAIREGHEQEKAALRAAHEREMGAEREAGRSRESRVEERLTSEREERRRDQDRFRQQMEERDRQWTDRLEQSKQLVESTWQARHGSEMSAKDVRIDWLNGELERLRSELAAEKAKVEDRGDMFTQLDKYRQLKGMLGEFADKPSASSTPTSSGGIGMGGADGWQQTLVEGLSERAPDIIQALMGGGAAAAAVQGPAQQQLQEGQEVNTPQGPMIVVRDPANGQMRMARKDDLIRYQQHMAKLQEQQAQGQRANSPPTVDDTQQRERHYSAVPNFAEGLPKRRPPWEGGGGDDDAKIPPPPPEAPSLPRMSTRTEPEQPEHMELSSMERQGLKMIATEVESAIMHAQEPDDFVQTMVGKYPPEALQGVVGGYSDRQIARAIVQLFPNSAGATPLGQDFVVQAFAKLRKALS